MTMTQFDRQVSTGKGMLRGFARYSLTIDYADIIHQLDTSRGVGITRILDQIHKEEKAAGYPDTTLAVETAGGMGLQHRGKKIDQKNAQQIRDWLRDRKRMWRWFRDNPGK